MNIKEHIEAGHYPTDDKGRARVPMRSPVEPGEYTVTIYATDFPGPRCIVGQIAYGSSHEVGFWLPNGFVMADKTPCARDLLLPVPRKEKVKRYAVYLKDGTCWSTYSDLSTADANARNRDGSVVTLHGEREVLW